MRFIVVISLCVGLALGSPIGQVGEVTTNVPDLLRSDIIAADEATTIVVEVLADEGVTSGTERARQGENESDEEEDEATTPSGASSSSSAGRIRPPPAIPQPFANSSNFLAEYEFSSQFNLGPKDESVPLAGAAPVTTAAAAVPANQVVPQAVAAAVPALPPSTSGAVAAPVPNAAGNKAPTIVAGGEDEDDAESDEGDQTEAPSAVVAASAARQQPPQQQVQQQQPEVQRIEESDSDNEISNDDITTVKSFASEYEYTVQQLGSS